MVVQSINPRTEIDGFCTFLYGEATGVVYSPTYDREADKWEQAFFNWPDDKVLIIEHMVQSHRNLDVYIAPALFLSNNSNKRNIKGSHVIWSEFDGVVPSARLLGEDVPSPTWRIQSSEPGHEHMYWRLDHFERNIDTIEAINKAITYKLGADASGWDANQVLRPPGTINHKRNKPVHTLFSGDTKYGTEDFAHIPVPERLVSDSFDQIPDLRDVIAHYPWPEEVWEFFKKGGIDKGHRSDAIMHLAYDCAELGMSDPEIMSILLNADDRWGKFKGRNDRMQRLADAINRARLKYAFEPLEGTENFQVFSYNEFMRSEVHIEWYIEGVLQKNGMLMLTGEAGIGKSQLSLRFANYLATGRPFLDWQIREPGKVIFFSMEMDHAELRHTLDTMVMDEGLTEEEKVLLDENFHIIPLGFGLSIDKGAVQKKIRETIEEHEPDGIIFDSFGISTEESVSDEKIVKSILQFCQKLRQQYGLFIWFIHHQRKAQSSNKRPRTQADLYGSQYIAAQVTSLVALWRAGEDIDFYSMKVRLGKPFSYRITRTPNLDFTLSTRAAPISTNPDTPDIADMGMM